MGVGVERRLLDSESQRREIDLLRASIKGLSDALFLHVHEDSIMPDMDIIDPSTRHAAVNSLIIFDLAKRAERHGNPYLWVRLKSTASLRCNLIAATTASRKARTAGASPSHLAEIPFCM